MSAEAVGSLLRKHQLITYQVPKPLATCSWSSRVILIWEPDFFFTSVLLCKLNLPFNNYYNCQCHLWMTIFKWLSVIMSCSAKETSTYQLITNVSSIPTQLLLEVDIRIYVNRGDGSKGCNNLGGTMEQFCYNNYCYNV